MVYAVVLGFVVIVVWEQFNAADQHTHHEAAAIVGVSRPAGSFPEPDRERIRQALRDYTRTAVDQEWANLARGELSRDATARMESLWQTYRQFEPRTEQEKAAYTESLKVLTALNELRVAAAVRQSRGRPLWDVDRAGSYRRPHRGFQLPLRGAQRLRTGGDHRNTGDHHPERSAPS